jgi:predicted transcriptional regulator
MPPPPEKPFQQPRKRQIVSICSKTLVRPWRACWHVISLLTGKRQTETARAALILAKPPQEPLNVLPKNVALSQAKREERLAQYHHVVALREQGFSQTAIAAYVGISHATVSRWLRNGTFPEQKPRPRSARVDSHLPQLVERWKAGNSTVAELHRELVADGYSHQYNERV